MSKKGKNKKNQVSRREEKKIKRAQKKKVLMDSAMEKLKCRNIPFTVHNKGLHLIVQYDKKIADFWPTTGRFKVRDEWGYRFGVDLLIEKLGYVEIIHNVK